MSSNRNEYCSAPLGSCCCGIPIRLHVTFFLLLGLELFAAWRQWNHINYLILTVVLYGPVLLVTIIVHELGHAMMNRQLGERSRRVVTCYLMDCWLVLGWLVLSCMFRER